MTTTDSTLGCPQCGGLVPAGAPQGLCPKCVMAGAISTEPAPIATAEIPSLERISAAFPDLQIIELIGRGAMGFVFKARQRRLDRFVALKLLPESLACDPQFADRFNREGRVLARLNHPSIVSIFDFGQVDGLYFLLMEYVDGVNLRQAMHAGKFSPSEALAIVPRICEALQFAHDEGVLHRDIKPENILLDGKGRVKIADFGIAKIVGEGKPDVPLTGAGAALGTPHYMAPEQFEKPATVDHRADIYSLGVVFYEMLTGELPIGRFSPPSQRTPVDPRVDDVVMRTLEKEREKRFQSAGEMKADVEHLTESGAGTFKRTSSEIPNLPHVPGSGPQITPVVAPVPAWTKKAVWGAALVSVSAVTSAFLIVCWLTGKPDIAQVLSPFAAGAIPFGVAGTFLGWMALSDIRANSGRLRGLAFAVFAALTWPLCLLVLATVVAPIYLFADQLHADAPVSAMGRGALLLLPAGSLTFAIWVIYTSIRWGSNRLAAKRRGVLKWIFAGVMASALGLVLVNGLPRHGQRSALGQSPLSSRDSVDAGATAKVLEDLVPARKLQLRIPTITHDPFASVSVTTESELPLGDYLVGLMKRPDGRLEEKPASITIFAGSEQTRVMQHVIWSMTQFESNRVRGILAEMRATVDGRVIELRPGERSRVFQVTNDYGNSVEGFISIRSGEGTNPGGVTVAIVDTPQHWPYFLSVKLRISAPLGYAPHAVGLLGDGSALETTTSISGRRESWSGDNCLWYLPKEFQKTDVQEIVRQIESIKAVSPNGIPIPPGQRVPVFAVTNPAGFVFRGFFESPTISGTKRTLRQSSPDIHPIDEPAGVAERPAAPQKIELSIPTLNDDPYKSVSVTTDSQLPLGDYLVGLLQRPDGRLQEIPAIVTVRALFGEVKTRRHLIWPMTQFETNRVREVVSEMRATLNGRVVALTPGGQARIFQITNEHGNVTEGFIALRSQDLNPTNLPPVTVSIAEIPANLGTYSMVKLRISSPPGYFPYAVGLLADGSEFETSTSIVAGGRPTGWKEDYCIWRFPPEFRRDELQEIARQLEAIKIGSPNGLKILPGRRVPIFCVTNQAGAVLRSYFELPATTEVR